MVCYNRVRQLFYFKVQQVLQSAIGITKCDRYYNTKCDRKTHKTLKLTWQPYDAGNVTRVFVRTLLLAYPWKRSQTVKTNQTIPPRVYF